MAVSATEPEPPAARTALAETLIQDGKNPLISAAAEVIGIIEQLPSAPAVSDVGGLRNRVVHMIEDFETKALNFGCDEDSVITARYCLCAAVDEVVLLTPWGSASLWARQSLVSSFHGEAWGGERFFVILKQLQERPDKSLPLLELMYLLISLGFLGQYQIMDQGTARLERLTQSLYETIRVQRDENESRSPHHGRGGKASDERSSTLLPWISGLIALGVLLVGYLLLSST